MAWIRGQILLQVCAAPTGKEIAFVLGRAGVAGSTSGVALPTSCSVAYITVKVETQERRELEFYSTALVLLGVPDSHTAMHTQHICSCKMLAQAASKQYGQCTHMTNMNEANYIACT